jgi:three-Cys-motif partner protein
MSEGEPDRDVDEQPHLFEVPDASIAEELPPEPLVKSPEIPVWTDNKARLIMLYLKYFVFITKHGTYIDGFAGPQDECETDSWAAKLVLESEPRWMRHFHLCDENRMQFARLERLKNSQPQFDSSGHRLHRDTHLYRGDFNAKVDEILATGNITENEATFCLLDQRTFECQWMTVEKLACYKKSGNKIELFYFLANGWLERALAGQKDLDVLERWWGRDDWTSLRSMTRDERKEAIVLRMKSDLRYKSVKAWPIYERPDGGATMYYMIHATDHPDAPMQMSRAYRHVVRVGEPAKQIKLDLLFDAKGPNLDSTTAQLETQRSA